VPPEPLDRGDPIHVVAMGFARWDDPDTDGKVPDVSASAEGVPLETEIRLTFDGFLDPATISPRAIVLRTGDLDRGTTLRWDFQSGSDFEDLENDEPASQLVAIRATSDLAESNQYRVVVTDALRGLLGQRVVPFEGFFQTGTDLGAPPPPEPPAAPDVRSLFEGNTWRLDPLSTDCRGETPPPECKASCGWAAGPCHRLITDNLDPQFVEFGYPGDPAMDLLLCRLKPNTTCEAVFDDAPAPFRDLYDFSAEWPTWRLVEPGAPEWSYLLYKVLGVPGIDGGPMPRRYDARDHEPYTRSGHPLRSDFVQGEARALRDWIAAGAPPE
jgi:hypothetical protein